MMMITMMVINYKNYDNDNIDGVSGEVQADNRV